MRWFSFRFILAAVAFVVAFGEPLAQLAYAAEGGSGRIKNPAKLREKAAKGRSIKAPPIPDPPRRQPVRASAKIPSPEPRARGGHGYQRRGKYFYEEPTPITLNRNVGKRRRLTVPPPTRK
jgi:hypothetical protein